MSGISGGLTWLFANRIYIPQYGKQTCCTGPMGHIFSMGKPSTHSMAFWRCFYSSSLSLTATYNTITIFAFVMGGMTMYWLAYYLTRSFWGSIIAGFIFTFSNYHFMHAQGHLQLVSLEWIPLFILCWYSLITKPHTAKAVGAAIVLWMVLLCDNYYFFYCCLSRS